MVKRFEKRVSIDYVIALGSYGRFWRPQSEMRLLEGEASRLFSKFGGSYIKVLPSVNVWKNENNINNIIVAAEISSMDENDIEVSLGIS